jgi:hypothetical protein
MITWLRPSGALIRTNDSQETIELAVSRGWIQSDQGKALSDETLIHIELINEIKEKEDVISYLNDLGLSIDARGGLEKVKEKAITAIKNM